MIDILNIGMYGKMSQNSFNCYFIGDDSLIIEFSEILLAENHQVLGFVTTNEQVKHWADTASIPCFNNLDMLAEAIKDKRPDYLFSFVNNKVIPSSILDCVNHFAINYHNAMLPKYAGNHATSWAILNNEKKHGITWHKVTNVIDGGDILKQAEVDISVQDTTLSLDFKCLRKALETFPQLIKELAENTYTSIKQENIDRDYYALHQKPPGNGLIDWSTRAEDIDNLCRALNFSPYKNRLALPKCMIGDGIYIVQEIKIVAPIIKTLPGTILELSNTHLVIATITNAVKLSKLLDINGQVCSIKYILTSHQIKEGDRLPLKVEWRDNLEKISRQFSSYESYWVKKLSTDNPISLPFSPLEKYYAESKKGFYSFEFEIPNFHSDNVFLGETGRFALLTILFIYFYRINHYQHGSVVIQDERFLQANLPNGISAFFTSFLPYSIHLNPEMRFVDAVNYVRAELNVLQEKKSFSRDVFIRYPSLKEKHHYPVSITLANNNNHYQPNNDYLINFLITDRSNKLKVFIKNNLSHKRKEALFVKKMKKSIQALLNAIADDEYQVISHLPLLMASDYKKMVVDWNKTHRDDLQAKTLHELIEKNAKKNPNQTAVIYKKSSLSYSLLNDKANHLAAYLRKRGVSKEEPVILCINNSLELIVGILGILKAGCAYVPVDHKYNKVFIEYILSDSKAKIILTNAELASIIEPCIPVHTESNLILLDTHWSLIEKEPINEGMPLGLSTDLAYILYTSGSTGKPKGCLIEHKSVINLLDDFQRRVPLTSQDRATFWTSIGFDVSIYEIFSPLLAGASLHLFNREEISLDPYQYFERLKEYKISSAYIPPFMLEKFLSWIKSTKPLMTLKRLLVGVEPIHENLLLEIQRSIPGLTILNGYGPTETTVCSTLYVVQEKKIKDNRIIPIGKPVANTQIYIVDPFMQPVPIGIVGELCIAGRGLSRGYLNKHELTQTKFVANPFSSEPQSRLYKTGDLACWLTDGNIEFHGRSDNQIKIRGFRVELGAIEDCLLAHPAISHAIVNVELDQYQHKHIIAYLLFKDLDYLPDVTEIRHYLHARLSEYMIPSSLFVVDAFPVTTNGKVDKKALSSLPHKRALAHKDHVPAHTVIQQHLVQIWQEFLPVNEIGIHDDFFALGGHSLLVAEIFTRIQQEFKRVISLSGFLKKPTIKYLANQLEHGIEESHDAPDFSQEVQLEPGIQPLCKLNISDEINAVLLTGATGFVGVHLLNELYRSTKATIYCLIRAENKLKAQERLDASLKYYHFSELSLLPRINILVGDLAAEKFGLSDSEWKRLSEEIDVIYHNGAWVHHVYNYETLKASNVYSTIHLLKLASTIKPKILHYFSTLTSTIPRNNEASLTETFPDGNPEQYILNSGYEQTKWVSECLLTEAKNRGFAVNIFRLGWVGAQRKMGICSPNNNHFLLFMKGCIQLDSAPDRTNSIDIVPVDVATKVIVALSLAKTGQVFHISGHSAISWAKLIAWINEAGYPVKLVAPAIWHEQHLMHIDNTNALYPFLPLYRAKDNPVDWLSLHENLPKIETKKTNEVLSELQLTYPDFLKHDFFACLQYLQNSGFLKLPTKPERIVK